MQRVAVEPHEHPLSHRDSLGSELSKETAAKERCAEDCKHHEEEAQQTCLLDQMLIQLESICRFD